MSKEKEKNKIELEESLLEIKKLAEQSEKNKGFKLDLDEGEDFEKELLSIDSIDDIQNPDKSYKVYYAIEGILKKHLPKGEEYRSLTKKVREEKIIFLTGGKKLDKNGIRGADSRQAYISTHLEVAFKICLEWLQTETNPFNLFLKFRELNIERGYFKENEKGKFDQSK